MPPSEVARLREVRRLVAAHLDGHPVHPVERLGEGTDHVAYRVAGRLIVRFAMEPDASARAELTRRELDLLRAVAGVSPLAVPAPVFADPDAGCLAYVALPGVPLLTLGAAERASRAAGVTRELGAFLAALHRLPAASMGELVEIDQRPPGEWREEAAATYASVAGALPAAYRPAVSAFLAAPPPEAPFGDVRPAFTHNDLGIEHVLVDPATGRVTGVIDWSDAAVADPAADFARLERDLGPAAVDAALAAYGEGGGADGSALAHLRARAAFYARCLVLEDLAFGLETGGDVYVEKSIAALRWLFPA